MQEGDKTEKATPKRRRDERKKGNVFSSKEVATLASLVIVFFFIKLYSPYIISDMKTMVEYFFTDVAGSDTSLTGSSNTIIIQTIKYIAIAVLPIAFIAIIVPIIATGAQTRFNFTMSLAAPKFNRLNPIKGLKNLFSLRALVELLKSIGKIIIVGYVLYSTLIKYFPTLPNLLDVEPLNGFAYVGNIVMKIVLNITYIFIIIAIADFAYQWYEYEKNLRMSKQEIKEEYKQMEGDPQVKGQIKERQRAMSQRRMMQEVPKADVIVRNPTHYACALKYEAHVDRAPVLLAKGKDLVAQRIVEIAEKNGIITTENVPLARGLYKSVEIGREIPPDFYQSVAEVLAWVYKMKNKN